MGFFDHLEQLRWHLVRIVIVVSIFGVGLFIYRQEIIGKVMMSPFKYDFISYRIVCENFSDAFCPPIEGDAEMFNPAHDSLYVDAFLQLPAAMSNPGDTGLAKTPVPVRLRMSAKDFGSAGTLAGLKVKRKNGEMVEIQAISPYEQFMKAMIYALFGGLILAFPYVVWEVWRFIRPALNPKEVKGMRGNVLTISMLFFTGIIFSYFVILPISIQFLASFVLFEEAENIWRIGDVISFEMMLLFGTGLMFQLPMAVYYLSRLGMITPQWLRKYRRHSIVVLLIIAGMVTPPDPFSQILVFVPMMALYESGIIISARVQKRLEKEELESRKK